MPIFKRKQPTIADRTMYTYVELFSDHACGHLNPNNTADKPQKIRKSFDDINDVTTRAKLSKMYFKKKHKSHLDKIIKGDVIFIPKFKLLHFQIYSKMSPTTYIDLERAE